MDLKEQYEKQNSQGVLEQIIEQAFNLFSLKLAKGGIIADNEYAFQFELGIILKTLGKLYEFKPEDKFDIKFESNIILPDASSKSQTKRARMDIYITYKQHGFKDVQGAIELKFLKKANKDGPRNRYKVFLDISNLESYKNDGIECCYFLLITDNLHYVSQQKYSKNTSDFDFRHGQSYKANSTLSYRTKNSTKKDLVLKQDYNFYWENYHSLNFLRIKI